MSVGIDTAEFDMTIMKLLGKAGLDPRCTPNILRAKAEQKMKLEKDALVPYRVRMKKLIVKWWKENQSGNTAGEKRSAPSSSDSAQKTSKKVKVEGKSSEEKNIENLEKYKLFRTYTKSVDRHDLLTGLTDISEISDKVLELKKRLQGAGLKYSSADVKEAVKEAVAKKAAAA